MHFRFLIVAVFIIAALAGPAHTSPKNRVYIGDMPFDSFEEARAEAERQDLSDVKFMIDGILQGPVSLRALTGDVAIVGIRGTDVSIIQMDEPIQDVHCASLTIEKVWLFANTRLDDDSLLPLFSEPLNGTKLTINGAMLTAWGLIEVDNESGYRSHVTINGSYVTVQGMNLLSRSDSPLFITITHCNLNGMGEFTPNKNAFVHKNSAVELETEGNTFSGIGQQGYPIFEIKDEAKESTIDCVVDPIVTPEFPGFGVTLFNTREAAMKVSTCKNGRTVKRAEIQ